MLQCPRYSPARIGLNGKPRRILVNAFYKAQVLRYNLALEEMVRRGDLQRVKPFVLAGVTRKFVRVAVDKERSNTTKEEVP